MKLSKIKIALSIALLASSIQASAAVTGPTTTTGSSVIVSLVSADGTKAAAFDIGGSYRSFDFNTTRELANLSAGNYFTAWNSFSSAVGANLSTSNFAIFAGTNFGGLADAQYLTSVNRDSTLVLDNGRAGTASVINLMSTYIVDGLANQANHNAVADGASYLTSADTDSDEAFAPTYYDTVGLNFDHPDGFGIVALGTIGAANSLDLYKIYNGTTNTVGSELMGTLSLSTAGTLNYVAAVPEADTSLMMLSGIALMGFVARRRKSV